MNTQLLQKYISGHATEREKQEVTEWIEASPENMRTYMAQRKLYDISLWRSDVIAKPMVHMKKSHISHIYIGLLKIAVVLLLVLASSYFLEKIQNNNQVEIMQSIHVPAGQRAELLLADGTKVWLNSRSTLTFPGKFEGKNRKVSLNGEGYFSVTKNEKQPFIVETKKCDIKVLGTEFNVLAYDEDSIWSTSLLKGLVEIYPQGMQKGILRLEPNTMATLTGHKLVKQPIETPDYFLWREGILSFKNISVKDMIEKLELYYGTNITVNNTRILQNRYTGKFRTKDGIEHVLRVLQLNNKFTYDKNDERNCIVIN